MTIDDTNNPSQKVFADEIIENTRNCNNCRFQPGPLLMCAWMKEKSEVYLKCPRWESR